MSDLPSRFYGFRLAVRADLGSRVVRAWSIVPAAVNERETGTDLVCGDAATIDALLLDKAFSGSAFAAEMTAAGPDRAFPPVAPGAQPPGPARGAGKRAGRQARGRGLRIGARQHRGSPP